MSKILLVEDDNNLREIYEARLQAEGYTVLSSHDGEEALVIAKNSLPDLIISDVMMPKISGFEMLDILRNTEGLKNVKVIMLTALGQSEDQTRANNLGADRYLVKSQVTLEDIVNAVGELLGTDDLKDADLGSSQNPTVNQTTPILNSEPKLQEPPSLDENPVSQPLNNIDSSSSSINQTNNDNLLNKAMDQISSDSSTSNISDQNTDSVAMESTESINDNLINPPKNIAPDQESSNQEEVGVESKIQNFINNIDESNDKDRLDIPISITDSPSPSNDLDNSNSNIDRESTNTEESSTPIPQNIPISEPATPSEDNNGVPLTPPFKSEEVPNQNFNPAQNLPPKEEAPESKDPGNITL